MCIPFHAHLRQGWGPVWWGGWCRWWWRCPSSAQFWCRWLSDCRHRSRSLWCCPRRSQTPILPWWLPSTGRCSTGGSWPGLWRDRHMKTFRKREFKMPPLHLKPFRCRAKVWLHKLKSNVKCWRIKRIPFTNTKNPSRPANVWIK